MGPSARRLRAMAMAGAKRTTSISGLDAQTPKCQALAAQDPKFFSYFGNKMVDAAKINFLDFAQQRKIATELFADANESLQTFREAAPPKADARIQESGADAAIGRSEENTSELQSH